MRGRNSHKQSYGNRGEWAEKYTFLRMIADGDANKREDIHYDILRIIRQEDEGILDYVMAQDGETAGVGSGGRILLEVDRSSFGAEARCLPDTVKNSKGPSSGSPRTREFVSKTRCFKIKAPSADKSGITIQIRDSRTNMDPTLGFSIKSKFGHASALLNPGKTANMVFVLNVDVEPHIRQEGILASEPGNEEITKPSEKFAARGKGHQFRLCRNG